MKNYYKICAYLIKNTLMFSSYLSLIPYTVFFLCLIPWSFFNCILIPCRVIGYFYPSTEVQWLFILFFFLDIIFFLLNPNPNQIKPTRPPSPSPHDFFFLYHYYFFSCFSSTSSFSLLRKINLKKK